MKIRTLFASAALGTLISFSAGAQNTDTWPQAKPVTLIITSAAGGGTDTMGRLIGDRLSQIIGQTVVVENKPGANGMIGNDAVVRAAPDGHTLGFTYAATIVANKLLMQKMPHDPQTDLTPIAQVGGGGNFLVVSKDFPARTFDEFVKHVKANPGTLSYGSWGNGSGGHIAMEAIKLQTGLDIQHVPYKGTQPALVDLVGGRIQAAFADTSSSLPLLKSGEIIALANSGKRRSPQNPDVPTLGELGVKYDAEAWYGVFGPKGMNPAVTAKINAAINQILADPDMRERFLQLNMANPPLRSPQEFANTIASDLNIWGEVVKAANITLQ